MNDMSEGSAKISRHVPGDLLTGVSELSPDKLGLRTGSLWAVQYGQSASGGSSPARAAASAAPRRPACGSDTGNCYDRI
jgi:hypothetical protein